MRTACLCTAYRCLAYDRLCAWRFITFKRRQRFKCLCVDGVCYPILKLLDSVFEFGTIATSARRQIDHVLSADMWFYAHSCTPLSASDRHAEQSVISTPRKRLIALLNALVASMHIDRSSTSLSDAWYASKSVIAPIPRCLA